MVSQYFHRSEKGRSNRALLTNSIALMAVSLIVSFLLCALCPLSAFAQYSNPSINAIAQVQTNGSLHVVEQRQFELSEPYSILVWEIAGLPSDAEINVNSARFIATTDETQSWTTFAPVSFKGSWTQTYEATEGLANKTDALFASAETNASQKDSPERLPLNPSWAFNKQDSSIYLFAPFSGNLIIEVDYTAQNAMFVYDDVAELYWDYVPETTVAIQNVTTVIQLPVPEGEIVNPNENVYGWGHGPQGDVDVSADGTITYTIAQVNEGQYAQAHIIFPASWLPNASREMKLAHKGLRQESAIAEEAVWADTWSNRLINDSVIHLILLGICALIIMFGVVAYLIYGRPNRKKPSSDQAPVSLSKNSLAADTELQGSQITQSSSQTPSASINPARKPDALDTLMRYAPAIIGRLSRWNMESTRDVVAMLMSLNEKGIVDVFDNVELEKVSFQISSNAKYATLKELDRKTLHLIFDEFGGEYENISILGIKEFSRRKPKSFIAALDNWNNLLSKRVDEVGFFDAKSKKVQSVVFYVGIILAILSILSTFIIGWWMIFPLISSLILIPIANYIGCFTALGRSLSDDLFAVYQKITSIQEDNQKNLDATKLDYGYIYVYVSKRNDQHSASEVLSSKRFELTPFEKLWFAPRINKFGKECPCLAVQLKLALDDYMKDAIAHAQ